MKKLIPFLALAILISSCGNKMTLLKRHYTKGYYMHHSKQNEKTASKASISPVDKMEPTITAFSATEKTLKAEYSASLKPAESEVKIAKRTFQSNLSNHIQAIHSVVLPVQQKVQFVSEKKSYELQNKNSSSGDSMDIVLILLCIFIPFLAVFLKEDDITNHFWIDLILCLFFWLPGIIYAFYICFAK